jgi:hypothetical protein
MVIEHSFVTTLEGPEVLQAAAAFLQDRGFLSAKASAAPASTSLQMRRGQTNPARARTVADLPQFIRLDFDRGRVALAASITPSAVWGGRSLTNTELQDTSQSKRMILHTDLLMAILSGLERLLVQRTPSEVAAQDWLKAEERIASAARRHKRNTRIGLVVLILFVAAVLILATLSL